MISLESCLVYTTLPLKLTVLAAEKYCRAVFSPIWETTKNSNYIPCSGAKISFRFREGTVDGKFKGFK